MPPCTLPPPDLSRRQVALPGQGFSSGKFLFGIFKPSCN
jgi:hypothetical protein